MSEFYVNLSLYQKRIRDANQVIPLEPVLKHDFKDGDQQHQKINAKEIENGKELWGINFDRIMVFKVISVVLPMNILSCKIEKSDFLFFNELNNEICIAARFFRQKEEIDPQKIKKKYDSGMKKSKQKTIWIEEGTLVTLQDIEIDYMIAKHPMPQKNMLNLTFIIQTTSGIIAIVGSIYSAAEDFWIQTFKSMMETLRYVEGEMINGSSS